MSKWELLKSSLRGTRATESSSSIHRFSGYEMLEKKKKLWAGYCFKYSLDRGAAADLNSACLEFVQGYCEPRFEETDCAEIRVDVTMTGASLAGFLDALCENSGDRFNVDIERDGRMTSQSGEGEALRETQTQKVVVRSMTFEPLMKRSAFWSYAIPRELCTMAGEGYTLYTREKPAGDGVSLNGLLSNRLHGIDNTGNVCVWASESMLFYAMLENEAISKSLGCSRVLELGGGMTALCGLGLATMVDCEEVVLTDGHPDCVKNQRVCLQMTKQNLSERLQSRIDHVRCAQLRWSEGDEHGDLAAIMEGSTSSSSAALFDVILVADCLFFKDCHDALLWTLRQALSQTGTAYLLQPPRSGTMDLFLEKARACFEVYVHEEYCDKVAAMRAKYQADAAANGYVEDIHYPLLVTLKWPMAQADGK